MKPLSRYSQCSRQNFHSKFSSAEKLCPLHTERIESRFSVAELVHSSSAHVVVAITRLIRDFAEPRFFKSFLRLFSPPSFSLLLPLLFSTEQVIFFFCFFSCFCFFLVGRAFPFLGYIQVSCSFSFSFCCFSFCSFLSFPVERSIIVRHVNSRSLTTSIMYHS